MTYEKDEVWGARGRRTLASARPETHNPSNQNRLPGERMTGMNVTQTSMEAGAGDAFGPEAVARAREMEYDLTKRIQEESPYIHEEVVEHRVHDLRLYVGMWIVAGLSGVAAFLTFDLAHLVITAVAATFALISSPGRQRYEE